MVVHAIVDGEHKAVVDFQIIEQAGNVRPSSSSPTTAAKIVSAPSVASIDATLPARLSGVPDARS